MLSSSPSLPLSLQSPFAAASGDAAAPTGGETAPGFAELLNGLAGKSTQEAVSEGETVPGQAAKAARTAIASGKNLPVVLPDAPETDGKADAGAEAEAAVAGAEGPFPEDVVPIASGTLLPQHMPTGDPEPARAATAPSRRPAASVKPASAQPTARQKPGTQATETRPAPAVAITVAAPAQAAAPESVAAEPAVRPKPARAADLLRIEAPLPQLSAPASSVAQTNQPAPAANVPMANMPTPMPSAVDIDAALDQLVAAREALLPAEASLAIDHAEFGEVSIRFGQSSDGRLSAELASADPELQRAVAAAGAADRSAANASEGDGGRSAHQASHRGSATSGDAAQGDRGQSGGERDLSQRRAPNRPQARQAATDQRPGVFA